ncbi:MAG TPA: hypothetical protein VJL89_07440 [Thermodesulfovibrionia bacterium]|nr:hypothetical protein [Thermodesulfovibrionia bacterium]
MEPAPAGVPASRFTRVLLLVSITVVLLTPVKLSLIVVLQNWALNENVPAGPPLELA